MSYVNLFIVKDDNVYYISAHYQTAMKILEKGIEPCLRFLRAKFLDAGYLVIDCNKRLVINSQNAFPVNKVIGKKCLEVLEV